MKQKGGKTIICWAFEGQDQELTPGGSSFELEWPPHSGKRELFPEVDDVQLFALPQAQEELLLGQRPFLADLDALL